MPMLDMGKKKRRWFRLLHPIQFCSASAPFHPFPLIQRLLSVDFKGKRQYLIQKKTEKMQNLIKE